MLTRLLISVLGLTQLVAADSLLSLTQPSHAIFGTTFNRVSARQSSPIPNVPTACKPDCDPVNTQTAQGCSPSDCCKASFVTGYFNCLKCVGGALNITDFTPAQDVLDELTATCSAKGFNVPKLTLPGINPNRPLSLSSTRPSGTAGGGGPSPSQSTVSVVSSAPPLIPPPPLTTATGQSTVTTPLATAPPQSTAVQSAPPTSTTPSSARTDRFLTPHFSHLSAFVILFVGFIHFMI